MAVAQPYITEQVLLGVKSESTYGTIATPAAATDYIYVSELDLSVDQKTIERNYKHISLNNLQNAPGPTLLKVSFTSEYQTSGVAGTALAPYGALEAAAGQIASASANDVTYTLALTASTNFPGPGTSATMQVYYRDQLYTIKGVYGTITETHKSDGLKTVKFDGTGLYVTNSVATGVPSPTYSDNYVRVISGSSLLHSYDADFSEMTINYGCEIAAIPSVGDTYGYSKVMIVNRKPEITINPLMDSKSTFDAIGRRVSQATGSFTFNEGSGTGNRVYYNFPIVQIGNLDITEADGVYRYSMTLNPVGNWSKRIY